MTARASSVRTCVGCRERANKSDLLRVVVVEGACAPDYAARLPGRGAHVHLDLQCLDLAARRRAFPRALRVPGPLDITALRRYVEERVSQSDRQDGS
jgi:predicted RNA-binding protein YlxR (DUF448 family)